MKKLFLLLLVVSCAQSPKTPQAVDVFPADVSGCYLLFNLKTDTLEKRVGEDCHKELPASSTFKVPLAVMVFDANVLKDETEVYKWDGEKRMLDAWNKDHDARSWMKESVVWFSQKLTPKLGRKKVENYLKKFNYGNEDLSSGLTDAWLHPPGNKAGFLGISPLQQLEFMKKLWTMQLPVSARSMQLTQEIMYLETSPKGFRLSGKTGSNFYDREKNIQLGWFIAHISNGKEEYLSVVNLSDKKPYPTPGFGGPRAKELMKDLLTKEGLW